MGTLYRRTEKGNWQAEFTDHTGRRLQRSTKTRSKKLAQQILAQWETDVTKRATGLIDPRLERFAAQATRPIVEHVDEWIASLRSSGRSTTHTGRSRQRLETIIDFAGWSNIGMITPESVERFAAHLRDDLGRGSNTIANYIQPAKQFARWLSRTGRLPFNPLDVVRKPNPNSDRRRHRRMLLPAEWPWLREAAGPRAVLYETAIQTGLRAGELRSLKPSHVKHDAAPPHVIVQAGETKNKDMARQYITADLASRLAIHQPPSRSVFFDLPDEYGMADLVRNDMAAARAMWLSRDGNTDEDAESDFLVPTNDADESFDFHSLRHTCGAWLALQNVHPKTIQTVMRHKTITLTMDTYGHLFPDSQPEAIERLSPLLTRQ
ncbi:tyrosine-type recombinase/integrase [Crateriforma conspicua]|uniref:Site-specific tyrosine recombinase XerC n=1 Tax=Crateriforma conspicua TaxID=2527996 RepID=A0A5C5XSZ3_9PLAN|nr:tyrosine-type recombinase/integrase [Crateriforma conspicua]TWT65661.1 site-specific tyrosine recombinase XerC [Crateriforma conspicua]